MQIVITALFARRVFPMDEFGTLLEGRAAAADHLGLVDADRIEGPANGRESPFADAEDPDIRRFDELNPGPIGKVRAEPLRKIAGGQPPGRSPANDQYSLRHGSTG